MTTAQQALPRLLKASEVSEQTGLPEWRVYELSRMGVLPCVRLGRSYRYDPAALREFIAGGGEGEDAGAGS